MRFVFNFFSGTMVMAMLLFCLLAPAAAAAADPELSVTGENVTVSTTVDTDYPWTYSSDQSDSTHVAYIAGNSGTAVASVSNLAITVTGTGILTFDYKLSTPSAGKIYAFYYQLGSEITSSNYTSTANSSSVTSYRGDRGYWESATITIKPADLDSNGQATVYLAYYRGGTSTDNDNYVAIANVKYMAGKETLKVTGLGDGLGKVAVMDGDDLVDTYSEDAAYESTVGSTIQLTASPDEEMRFYGWVDADSGEFLSGESTYSFTFDGEMTVQAVFAAKDAYTARLNGTFYTEENGLEQALADAVSGDTVVMLTDQALTSDATVNAGVFLLLPCMDNDPGYVTTSSGVTHSPDGENAYNTENTLYATLTIPSGVTLTVRGEVLVNAQVGRPSGGDFDQDVNGGYAQIDLDGSIVVENGGWFENYGFVTGGGQVTAKNGSTLVDLYVVRSWRGGSHASYVTVSADHTIFPMNEIDCHNIQTTVRINYGASYQGAVRMYASNSFNYTRFPQIDNDNGLIRLTSASGYVIKTYDPDYTVTDSDGVAYQEGRTTIQVYGGAKFAGSTLTIVSMPASTSSYIYPVDGDIGLELYAGDYEVVKSFKLMPGCTVDVMDGANVTVGAEGDDLTSDDTVTLVMYDEFDDKIAYGNGVPQTAYPSYRPAAELRLHGGSTLTMEQYTQLAGHMVVDKDATASSCVKVSLNSKTTTSVTSYESNVYYNEVDKSAGEDYTVPYYFDLALINADGTESDLTPTAGRTYYGTGDGWTSTNPKPMDYDLNGDNVVNGVDLGLLLENYLGTGAGDINGDGIVNGVDLGLLLEHYLDTLN